MARTGSSLLDWLLKSLPEIDAKSELFHGRHQPTFPECEREALSRRSGLDLSDGTAFTAWRRAHPAATLEAIHEAGQRIVAFKVFPRHLDPGVLEADLMARSDIAFAILRRRPIECFISANKAQAARIYSRRDTTDIRPELSVEAFVRWARSARDWYVWCETAVHAHGRPFVRIGYERHLDRQSVADTIRDLKALLAPLGLGPLSEPAGDVFVPDRQDREPLYQNRVANWAAFEAAARAHPVGSKLLDWAERAR